MTGTKIDLSKKKFLVIDNQVYSRRLLANLLYSWGATIVREASSIEDGWHVILSFLPDLVFFDWKMSPIGGLSFLRQVRQCDAPHIAHIPIIMLTTQNSPDHVAAALGNGADSYIVKPFSPATLLSHTMKVIGTGGTSREIRRGGEFGSA